jgi:hypothetical protein
MALNIDRSAPDAHAQYDSGLVAAMHEAHMSLAENGLNDKPRGNHFLHELHWRVPWPVVPTHVAGATIEEYRMDVEERLRAALRERKLLSPQDDRKPDLSRFFKHWSHTLLSQSAEMHRQTERGFRTMPLVTPRQILETSRMSLWLIVKKRVMVMETPVHPLWGNRGNLHYIEQVTERKTPPYWVEETTESVRKFVRKILSGTADIRQVEWDRSMDIVQTATPELLSVDRGYIAEIDCKHRQQLFELLENKETFTPELRTAAVGHLVDIWAEMHGAEEQQALAQATPDGPSIHDDPISDVFGAYVLPPLQKEYATIQEKRDAVQRMLPVLSVITFRSLLDGNEKLVDQLVEVWGIALNYAIIRERLSRLCFLAVYTMDQKSTPREILAQC